MLILSRKLHQSIIINENIEISISHIDHDSIKLAIKAPKNIPVYRKEIFDAILASNQKAFVPQSQKLPISLVSKFKKEASLKEN